MVPGVRTIGVRLLPGVGPALTARRNGVTSWSVALLLGVACASPSSEGRCFLRADSAIVQLQHPAASSRVWIDVRETRRLDATSPACSALVPEKLDYR